LRSKCDARVEARLREAEQSGRPLPVDVIVTFRPGCSWKDLLPQGLQVRHVFEALHAVAGQVQTPRVRDIAALDWVLRIEFDGEVRALPDEEE
jgi:hypothetical protein